MSTYGLGRDDVKGPPKKISTKSMLHLQRRINTCGFKEKWHSLGMKVVMDMSSKESFWDSSHINKR